MGSVLMSLKQNDAWLENQKELQEEKGNMKAVFLGWQIGYNLIKEFPLFNVDAPTSAWHKSTVSLKTLKELGIDVPNYPAYEEWIKEKSK